jgi:hypothetical protein
VRDRRQFQKSSREGAMNVELNGDEVSILDELLSKEMQELPVEIHHTKEPGFKDYLKAKQQKIDMLLKKLH